MKYILTILLFALCSNASFAAATLNKNTAKQYFSATKSLEQSNPELTERFDSSDFSDKAKFMAMIRKAPQFSEIEAVIKDSGFSDFEAFYDLGTQIAGAMMAVQIEQLPAGMSIEQMFSTQEAGIEKMKAMGIPQAELEHMLKEVAMQKAALKHMSTLAQQASESDKAFVRENIEWFMDNMAEEETEEQDSY